MHVACIAGASQQQKSVASAANVAVCRTNRFAGDANECYVGKLECQLLGGGQSGMCVHAQTTMPVIIAGQQQQREKVIARG